MALKLKACPRCKGDLFVEPIFGTPGRGTWQLTCLQCGHSMECTASRATPQQLAQKVRRVAKAS